MIIIKLIYNSLGFAKHLLSEMSLKILSAD